MIEPRRTLAVTSVATLLVLAVYSVAPGSITQTAGSLHMGVGGVTWGLSAMSLGLAVSLLAVGALADDVGRRRVLVWSAAGLAVASALAALAPDATVFIAARVLQGSAGAGLIAASLAAIGHAFPAGRERTHATGVWAAGVGAGIAIGPLAGAALAASIGWRSAYWLQAIAAAVVVLAALSIAESRAATPRPIDLPGAATLGAAMACITAGLVQGRSGWTGTATIALLAAGVVLLGAFVAVELRQAEPMLDLRLLREPLFIASLSGALFTGLAIIGLMSYSVGLEERGLGIGGIVSAAVLATWSGVSMVVALIARRLPAHIPSNLRLAAGLGLAGLGEAGLAGLSTGSSWARLIPGLAIAGIGSGLANAALGRLAVESVPHERAGMGSGANNTARYVGGAAGVALVVAVGGGGHTQAALVHGWNVAALVSAALCLVGAAVAVLTAAPARQILSVSLPAIRRGSQSV